MDLTALLTVLNTYVPSVYIQSLNKGKCVHAFSPKSFLGAQAFPMTQRHESASLSTMWTSVQVADSAGISKTFVSSYKLKKNSRKLQGINLDPLFTGQTD